MLTKNPRRRLAVIGIALSGAAMAAPLMARAQDSSIAASSIGGVATVVVEQNVSLGTDVTINGAVEAGGSIIRLDPSTDTTSTSPAPTEPLVSNSADSSSTTPPSTTTGSAAPSAAPISALDPSTPSSAADTTPNGLVAGAAAARVDSTEIASTFETLRNAVAAANDSTCAVIGGGRTMFAPVVDSTSSTTVDAPAAVVRNAGSLTFQAPPTGQPTAWLFTSADRVTIVGDIDGSIIAPSSEVTVNGLVTGRIVAQSLVMPAGEVGGSGFLPTLSCGGELDEYIQITGTEPEGATADTEPFDDGTQTEDTQFGNVAGRVPSQTDTTVVDPFADTVAAVPVDTEVPTATPTTVSIGLGLILGKPVSVLSTAAPATVPPSTTIAPTTTSKGKLANSGTDSASALRLATVVLLGGLVTVFVVRRRRPWTNLATGEGSSTWN